MIAHEIYSKCTAVTIAIIHRLVRLIFDSVLLKIDLLSISNMFYIRCNQIFRLKICNILQYRVKNLLA